MKGDQVVMEGGDISFFLKDVVLKLGICRQTLLSLQSSSRNRYPKKEVGPINLRFKINRNIGSRVVESLHSSFPNEDFNAKKGLRGRERRKVNPFHQLITIFLKEFAPRNPSGELLGKMSL